MSTSEDWSSSSSVDSHEDDSSHRHQRHMGQHQHQHQHEHNINKQDKPRPSFRKRKPKSSKPVSFLTPSTQGLSILLAPIELQKRVILQKIRLSKTKDLDEKWQKKESLKILKSKRGTEKLERVKSEKKAKSDALESKKLQKDLKRREEEARQSAHVSLRRHAQESARIKSQTLKSQKYNLDMHSYVTAKKAFQAEMKARRDARRKKREEEKSSLKVALAAKIGETQKNVEARKRRETNISKKMNDVVDISAAEAMKQREKVLKMREEEIKKKMVIKQQKEALQNKRKLAWQEQLKRNLHIEALNNKREDNLKRKQKAWDATKNQVAVNRATFVDRLDAVLDSTRIMFDHLHVDADVGFEDEKKDADPSPSMRVNVEIGDTSPIRAGVKRAMTPVTPKDFFKWEEDAPEEIRGSPDGSDVTEETEATVKASNVSSTHGNIFSPGDPGLVSPDAHPKNPATQTQNKTPPAEETVTTPRQTRPSFEENDIFSPLDPSMTRGYSFSFTPAPVPSDDEIATMSPLQRTYTALKLRRGEDEGIRRMKDLIRNATG
ncbi:hypothetical protein TrVE_jg1654 [Triparma verrucosa]|uniref:Uncharacterized protein n=1 Tax=Triparma verrucosa TaxID=1606542 RepID=A0A9W7KXY3_9STRA|nr:hypothetical protein TrVE_jg1654 [Triparma verrucosa]